jgi:hypothetical protein
MREQAGRPRGDAGLENTAARPRPGRIVLVVHGVSPCFSLCLGRFVFVVAGVL